MGSATSSQIAAAEDLVVFPGREEFRQWTIAGVRGCLQRLEFMVESGALTKSVRHLTEHQTMGSVHRILHPSDNIAPLKPAAGVDPPQPEGADDSSPSVATGTDAKAVSGIVGSVPSSPQADRLQQVPEASGCGSDEDTTAAPQHAEDAGPGHRSAVSPVAPIAVVPHEPAEAPTHDPLAHVVATANADGRYSPAGQAQTPGRKKTVLQQEIENAFMRAASARSMLQAAQRRMRSPSEPNGGGSSSSRARSRSPRSPTLLLSQVAPLQGSSTRSLTVPGATANPTQSGGTRSHEASPRGSAVGPGTFRRGHSDSMILEDHRRGAGTPRDGVLVAEVAEPAAADPAVMAGLAGRDVDVNADADGDSDGGGVIDDGSPTNVTAVGGARRKSALAPAFSQAAPRSEVADSRVLESPTKIADVVSKPSPAQMKLAKLMGMASDRSLLSSETESLGRRDSGHSLMHTMSSGKLRGSAHSLTRRNGSNSSMEAGGLSPLARELGASLRSMPEDASADDMSDLDGSTRVDLNHLEGVTAVVEEGEEGDEGTASAAGVRPPAVDTSAGAAVATPNPDAVTNPIARSIGVRAAGGSSGNVTSTDSSPRALTRPNSGHSTRSARSVQSMATVTPGTQASGSMARKRAMLLQRQQASWRRLRRQGSKRARARRNVIAASMTTGVLLTRLQFYDVFSTLFDDGKFITLSAMFPAFDANGTGYVDAEEVLAMLALFCTGLHTEKVHLMYDIFVPRDSSKLSTSDVIDTGSASIVGASTQQSGGHDGKGQGFSVTPVGSRANTPPGQLRQKKGMGSEDVCRMLTCILSGTLHLGITTRQLSAPFVTQLSYEVFVLADANMDFVVNKEELAEWGLHQLRTRELLVKCGWGGHSNGNNAEGDAGGAGSGAPTRIPSKQPMGRSAVIAKRGLRKAKNIQDKRMKTATERMFEQSPQPRTAKVVGE